TRGSSGGSNGDRLRGGPGSRDDARAVAWSVTSDVLAIGGQVLEPGDAGVRNCGREGRARRDVLHVHEVAGDGAQGLTLGTATVVGVERDPAPHARHLDTMTVHELEGARCTRSTQRTLGADGTGALDVGWAVGEEQLDATGAARLEHASMVPANL